MFTKEMLREVRTCSTTGAMYMLKADDTAEEVLDQFLLEAGVYDTFTTGAHVLKQATQYLTPKRKVMGISTTMLMGMRVLNIVFKTTTGKDVKLVNKNGSPCYTFAYAYNVDQPEFSELGDMCFEQYADGTYHRNA